MLGGWVYFVLWFVFDSILITNIFTGRRRSSCVVGRFVRGSRSFLRRSICWWCICVGIRARSFISVR